MEEGDFEKLALPSSLTKFDRKMRT